MSVGPECWIVAVLQSCSKTVTSVYMAEVQGGPWNGPELSQRLCELSPRCAEDLVWVQWILGNNEPGQLILSGDSCKQYILKLYEQHDSIQPV